MSAAKKLSKTITFSDKKWSSVIGLYFLSFFHEHPVGYKIVRNILVARLLAQTTLRNILGTKNLHEILSDRDSISNSMQVMQLLSCS